MAVIQRPRDGAFLVSEHVNPVAIPFKRPLGGHVEFGEYAIDTARREILEEIGQVLTDVRLLGVVENIFDFGGSVQHEIVFLYTAGLSDENAYEIDQQYILDEAGQTRVVWRRRDATSPPLYPAGLT